MLRVDVYKLLEGSSKASGSYDGAGEAFAVEVGKKSVF